MKSNMAKNAHKSGKAHHKAEMEHHKMRDAHMSKKEHHEMGNADARAPKEVADNHQQGIARVKMKAGQLDVGQHGSMGDGWRHGRRGE